MVRLADLLVRTSGTCAYRNRLHSFISRFSFSPRRSGRILVKGLLGVSMPAALLSASLPLARPLDRADLASAATFALSATASAFVGDGALSDASLEGDLAHSVEGTLNFGAPATRSVAVTKDSGVNLRKGPSTRHASFGKLAQGAVLEILGREGTWYKVRSPRGTVGYVRGDFLTFEGAASGSRTSPRNSSTAANDGAVAYGASARNRTAARVALRYVGSRYRWGGASPRGFDCSGLVLYAYRQAGLSLPHKAARMYSTRYGHRIRSVGALQAGDIVFFANTAGRGITHVAIYVGGGRMVTANSPRTGVQLASINTRYWRSHFAGAIRP